MSPSEGIRFRERWIRGVLAHHRLVLVLGLIVTVVLGFLASQLRIDSDLRALLPQDDPVVQNLEQLEGNFGTGSVNVVVKGGTADQRHAFADALAPALEGSEHIVGVEYRLRSEYFVEHALYYLGDDAWEELVEHVEAWTHYELCTAQPDVCLGEPDKQAPERLRTFIRSKQDESKDRTGFADYYEREGIEALVLLAKPKGRSSDLDFARAVTDDSRDIAASIHGQADAPWAGSDLTWNIIGPYAVKADEHATIREDMVKSGGFALLGVLVVVYLVFRSGRAVFSLLLPLLAGVTWAMGATQLVLGHLNTLTSLISTVVMGMGIDAGIHFLLRARHERRTCSDAEAIERAFVGLVIPLLVASATTVGAFFVMASSAFPAFTEFGLIAMLGVGLCLLSMVTVFPALLRLVGIKAPKKSHEEGEYGRIVVAILRRPRTLLVLLLVVCGVASIGASRVGFERNGRKLQADRTRALFSRDYDLMGEIFGKDIHAGIVAVDDIDRAREILAEAKKVRAEIAADPNRETMVAEVVGLPDLLPDPSIDAEARQEAIEELTEDFPESTWERLEKRAKDDDNGEAKDDSDLSPQDARRLRKMFAAGPVTIDELPAEILTKLRGSSGEYAIYAYPNFDSADILNGVVFREETDAYIGEKGNEAFVGEASVYATMYQMMRAEAPIILGTAAGLISILVLLQMRSLILMLITVLPLVLSLWWLLALMGTTAVNFTLFNIPILPAILGIGVDNGVYLTDRIHRLRDQVDGLARGLQETGTAILAATATTAIGFASFIIADSGGLRGIGKLAVLGILCAAAAAILVIPTLSALFGRHSRK
ncbi:MAG: efflux RND transporter permease subunit [Nannocystaceae bacterium]